MLSVRYPIGPLVLATLAAACSGGPSGPMPLPEPLRLGEPVALPDDPARQFDFWLGTWDVQNLRAPSGGAWIEAGAARARVQSVAGGRAVLEQWNGALGKDPLIGFSLRAWDPSIERWSVWLNWHGGTPGGFNEMHGVRSEDRMELFPPGNPDELRYSFTHPHERSCRWERAKSADGTEWVTDWVMQFQRREEPLALNAANAPIVEPPAEAARHPETRALDYLIGAWEGPVALKGLKGTLEVPARARVTSMIDGFGLLQFLDLGPNETLTAIGRDTEADGWVALRTDSSGPGITRLAGDLSERSVSFTAPAGGLRESWSCPEADACSWKRETSTDGGASWNVVAEARLTRSASTAPWIAIKNARAPFDRILTGGQPTAEQFAEAARNGYRTVVNLRGPGEQGELPDQAALLAELGMEYVHIPMSSGDDLNADNAALLAEVLGREEAYPAIVHCASGNRVGALFGLKAHAIDGLGADEALEIAQRAGVTRMEATLKERLK